MTATVNEMTKQSADQIRTTFNDQAAAVRLRPELNTRAMRVLMAQAYVKAKAKMDALAATATETGTTTLASLTRAAFSIDDIAGSNPVDRAAASVSYRDAQDRVAAIESADEADALLTRAEDSGDELLARAIAQRAYAEQGNGFWSDSRWIEVLNRYVSTRPVAFAAIEALMAKALAVPQLGDMWAFVLPAPSELTGMQDFQIAALADEMTIGSGLGA